MAAYLVGQLGVSGSEGFQLACGKVGITQSEANLVETCVPSLNTVMGRVDFLMMCPRDCKQDFQIIGNLPMILFWRISNKLLGISV